MKWYYLLTFPFIFCPITASLLIMTFWEPTVFAWRVYGTIVFIVLALSALLTIKLSIDGEI